MFTRKKKMVGIIGAGAFGTALAKIAEAIGHQVTLWFYEKDVYDRALENNSNEFLPGFNLDNIILTTNLSEACLDKEFIILANPARHNRKILEQMKKYVKSETIIICVSKGFDTLNGLHLMSDVIKEVLPNNYEKSCYLSGGSFADELAMNKLTVVDLASKNNEAIRQTQKLLTSKHFGLHHTNDIIQTQLNGALKNIIAIAAGILEGMDKASNNSKAVMIKLGQAEITHFSYVYCRSLNIVFQENLYPSYSGLGDLFLTVTSPKSRNYQFGYDIGQGKSAQSLIQTSHKVIEGYYTTKVVYEQAKKLNINLLITRQLYQVLYENKDIKTAFKDLTKNILKQTLNH